MGDNQIICRGCGTINPNQAQFCGKCGQKLLAAAPPTADTIFCPYCEARNVASAMFCKNCGRALPQISPATEAPVIPPSWVTCPNCHTANPAAAVFCGTCGQSLGGAVSDAHPPDRAPAEPSTNRKPLYFLLATAAVFLLSLGIYFLLPRFLSNVGGNSVTATSQTVTGITPDPTAAETDEATNTPMPTLTATLSPTRDPTATATAWPTVTPESIAPPVITPSVDISVDNAGGVPLPEITPLSGNGLMQLSFGPERDYTPAFSPDQGRVVYSSEIDSVWQLVAADVNGTGATSQITSGSTNYQAPDFSPDGRTLLVSSDRNGDWDIYEVDSVNGAIIAQLTDMPGDEYHPHWLPDGTGFVFSWMQNDVEAIYVQYFGGALVELVRSTAFEGFAWPSPDGQQIAFYSGRDGDYEIYAMGIDGSNQSRLTVSRGRDASPTWSPDGAWIAFESDRNGSYDLFIMRPDGNDLRQLTAGSENDWFPNFSPDGQWLIFQSDRAGGMDLFRMPFAP